MIALRPSVSSFRPSAAAPRGAVAVLLAVLAAVASAGEPPGYYASVDASSAAALRSTLHAVIDDHVRFPYTSGSTDTWDVLELADEDPGDAGRILDVYRNASYVKVGGGSGAYNREHTWPNSYGFPDDGSGNYPYTDCHQLRLCDISYNSARENKPFGTASAAAAEWPTLFDNGTGGTVGVYPGTSNWTTGTGSSGTWEVWSDQRGDIARAMFYMDVRYEGGVHGGTFALEPQLQLTDDLGLIAASATGDNELVAYMGRLSVLLQWHVEDPVDDRERARNDVVFGFQGNRNPFIDRPEWVACLYADSCGGGDVTRPATPTGLVAIAGDGIVALDWDDVGDGDLLGYSVFRSTSSGGPYDPITGALLSSSDYDDTTVVNGTTYFYVVTASDTSGNESAPSGEASATPSAGGTPPVAKPWINELHYDNASTDVGEFVEVAGPAFLDLSGWSLVAYNGNGGGTYDTVALSGILADQQGCIGTATFDFAQLQNGDPDGIALVDPQGAVVEFLSYEGAFIAADGPAAGMMSTDIGVSESSATAAGESLQLGGVGNAAADFTWQRAQAETRDLPNANQTFDDPAWTDLRNSLAGALGAPSLTGCGPLTAGSTTTFTLAGAVPASTAYLLVGLVTIDAPFKGGTLVPSPDVVIPLPTAGGTLVFGGAWPAGVPSSVTLAFQAWIVDATGPAGFSATNAIAGTTP